MNTKIISAIAFKLFAIYMVVYAITTMPSIAGIFFNTRRQIEGMDATPFWPIVIAITTIIVTGIAFRILWKLSNSFLMNVSEISDSNIQSIKDTESHLFSLLGTYFCVSALVSMPVMAAALWTHSYTVTGITIPDYAWLFSTAAQFVIGLHLAINARKWLSIIRNVGVK